MSGAINMKNLSNVQSLKLDWQGWNEDYSGSKVEYFGEYDIACKCTIPCEKCGFNYLNDKGEYMDMVAKTDTPLCGVW